MFSQKRLSGRIEARPQVPFRDDPRHLMDDRLGPFLFRPSPSCGGEGLLS